MQITAHLYKAKVPDGVYKIDDIPEDVTPEYISGLHTYFRETYPQHITFLKITNV